jgi:hypothetical protein
MTTLSLDPVYSIEPLIVILREYVFSKRTTNKRRRRNARANHLTTFVCACNTQIGTAVCAQNGALVLSDNCQRSHFLFQLTRMFRIMTVLSADPDISNSRCLNQIENVNLIHTPHKPYTLAMRIQVCYDQSSYEYKIRFQCSVQTPQTHQRRRFSSRAVCCWHIHKTCARTLLPSEK